MDDTLQRDRIRALPAVFVYLLLADIAIETFWSGSPVRWWVAGAVAMYALASAALWTRVTWRTQATASAVVLMAIMATAAWFRDGLTNGVRVFGLSTTTVLSLAAGAGVALAAMVLARQPKLPRPVRWSVVVLGGYGAISFLHGALTGAPFPALLAGVSLWRGLPYLLQGAVIGGLVILPLALMVSAVRAGLRSPVPGSSTQAIRHAAALAAAFAIVVAALPHRGANGAGAPDGSQSDARASRAPLSPSERIATLESSIRAIEDGLRESPRDRWDPDYVVQQIGTDPSRLFEWVRDNTSWIPYRGSLRGPVGVLMDGQGNSLDRSLLLATLLQKAGHSVRLAHAGLSERVAAEMLPRILATRLLDFDALPEERDNLADGIKAAAAHYQLDAAEVQQTLNSEAEALELAMLNLDQRVGEQTKRLLSAVRSSDDQRDTGQRLAFALEALQDHWWVQQESGGKWIDLDALDPDDPAGNALSAPIGTAGLTETDKWSHHDIILRVIAEHVAGDALTERPVLEHRIRPAELVGRQIVLQFFPTELPSEHDPITNISGFRERVAEQSAWAAALLVDQDVVAAAELSDARVSSEQSKGGPLGGLGASAARALEGGQRGRPASILTATWIEYEIRSPGRPNRTIRRVVFDLLGPVARTTRPLTRPALDPAQRLSRSLSMMMRTEILLQSFAFAPEYLSHFAAQSIVSNRDLLRLAVRGGLPDESARASIKNPAPVISPLYALAFARLEWSPQGERTFIDRPNILTLHRFVSANHDALAMQVVTDIVANEIGVSLTAPDAFAVRVEQGVRDTNAESLLSPGAVGENTAVAFAASADWVSLTSTTRADVATLRLSDNARRALEQELDAGFDLVAPREPVRARTTDFVGWWRVDRHTGDTLGVAENGWGQERAVQYNMFREMAKGFVFDEVFCRGAALAIEPARPFIQTAAYSWAPKWWVDTLPPPGNDKNAYEAGKAACLFGAAIAQGVMVTLPLVMMTVRFSRLGNLAARVGKTLPKFRSPRRPGGKPGGKPPSGSGPGTPSKPPVDPLAKTDPGSPPTKISPPGPEGVNPKAQGPKSPQTPRDRLRKAIEENEPNLERHMQETRKFVREAHKAWKEGRPIPPEPDSLLAADRAHTITQQEVRNAQEAARRDALGLGGRSGRSGDTKVSNLPGASTLPPADAGGGASKSTPAAPASPCPPDCPGLDKTLPAPGTTPPEKTLVGLGGIGTALGRQK